MADRYWVGGTGTWDSTSTTNWSDTSGGSGGFSVPTASDNVFFDAGSDAGGIFTVTMANSPRVCNDFTASGLDFTMTLAGASIGLTVSGSLEFPATNFTRTYTGTTTFDATTTGKTITTNGVAFGGGVTLNGVGGEWTLGSAFSCGTNTLILTDGTFDTSSVGNYSVTVGSFSSSNSNTRTINLNASTVTSSASWFLTNATNATLSAGTSTISLSASSGALNGGGLTYYNVSFTSTVGTGSTKSITGANTFNNLTFSTIAGIGLNNISIGADQTINGTFTVNGSNGNRRMFVRSDIIGTSRTLTCAAIASMTDVDFRDITIAGAHGTLSGTRLGDCGGNSNITFDAGVDKYWNLAAGGNWSATAWALSSGGSVADVNFPLAQDTVIIENTGLNTSATITINAFYNIGNFDASTRTDAMTLAATSVGATFYGNFTYGSGVTSSGTGTYTFSNRATKTLNSGGKTFTQPIVIDAPGGGIQLLTNNLTNSQYATLTRGTLDLNNLTLTTFGFISSNSNTRTIAFGTGNISCSGTGTTVWTTVTATGLTTTGTQVVNVTSSGSSAMSVFSGALSEANSISFNFTGGTYALTFLGSSGHTARDIDFTGFAGTWNITRTVTIYGNLTLSTGMTLSTTSFTTTFGATSGVKTITSNGKTIDAPITFNGVGGTWQLQDAMTLGSTRTATLTNGTIDLFGSTFTVGTSFATATGTKNITFNGGTLVCPNANTTSFNNAAPTNFTTTAGTGTGIISMTAATAKTFVGGGSTYNCTLNQGGAGTLTITGANTFDDITNTEPTANQITFPVSTTTTVSNFTLSGSSGNLVSIRSSSSGTQFTLSKSSGTVSVSFLDIQDSNAAGGATWQASASNGNVDSGNNLGWSFVAVNYVDASADVTADATVTGSALRVRLFAGDISAAAAISAIAFRTRLFAGDISANSSISAISNRVKLFSGDIFANSSVEGQAVRVRLNSGSIASNAFIQSQASRIRVGSGDIAANAFVEGQAVRVRVASGDITGNTTVTGIGNITAGGSASISTFAEVSAYGSAIYSFNALVTANADVIATGQIIGEEWSDSPVTVNVWGAVSPASSIWTAGTQTNSEWLKQ